MKVMASGDHHIALGTRWTECVRVHDWIVEQVQRHQPDLFVSGGDVYDRASTPREREFAAEHFARIGNVCPVAIVKGNHDANLDLKILSELRSEHPIVVEEGASVRKFGGVAVALMAWPDRARLAAYAGTAQGIEGLDQDARAALQAVMRGLGRQLAEHDGPKVAVGHWQVDGCMTSTGQPLVGHGMSIGLADLALLGADFLVMSHIHMPQEFSVNGVPAVYCGSPYRTAFGEEESKSIVLAEFDERGLKAWQRIETPATPMQLFELTFNPETGNFFGRDGQRLERMVGVAGAEVRFRYHVDAEHRDAARAAAEEWEAWLLRSAADVKVEECVRPKSTARMPEIATYLALDQKLRAMWHARGITLTDTEADRLVSLALELEGEVRHAAA